MSVPQCFNLQKFTLCQVGGYVFYIVPLHPLSSQKVFQDVCHTFNRILLLILIIRHILHNKYYTVFFLY